MLSWDLIIPHTHTQPRHSHWRNPNWGNQNTQQCTQLPMLHRDLSWLPRAMSLEQPSRWAFQFSLLMWVLAGPVADWLQVMLCLFVFIYSMRFYQKDKELCAWRGILQYWDLFIDCKCANDVSTKENIRTVKHVPEKGGENLVSRITEEQYPTCAQKTNLSDSLVCVYVCRNRSSRPSLGFHYNLFVQKALHSSVLKWTKSKTTIKFYFSWLPKSTFLIFI